LSSNLSSVFVFFGFGTADLRTARPTFGPIGRPTEREAFTRLELLVVLGSICTLICLCLPALASTKPKADLIVCANNLRQIGNAWQMWGSEHGDNLPWMLP